MKMSDVFELPLDEGIFGYGRIYLDEQVEAFVLAVNAHDSVTDQLKVAEELLDECREYILSSILKQYKHIVTGEIIID